MPCVLAPYSGDRGKRLGLYGPFERLNKAVFLRNLNGQLEAFVLEGTKSRNFNGVLLLAIYTVVPFKELQAYRLVKQFFSYKFMALCSLICSFTIGPWRSSEFYIPRESCFECW